MTVNQTFGDYELVTDEDGARLKIRHTPTGNEIVVHQGTIEDTDGNQVLGSQQSSVGKLTDNTSGSTDETLAAVSGSGDDATINNNLAELNAKIDAIIDVLGSSAGHGLTSD